MGKRKRQFGAQDIGAELLPIITTGLYRDPLDALREYVQNAIDAKAKRVEIKVTPDLVSIRDDGQGMTRDVAERAIRLGMSEKNPAEDVGFRGVGVYSGFNICNRLEIFTRARESEASRLVFDFEKIRDRLAEEEDRRLAGEPSDLDLVGLFADAVLVDTPEESALEDTGTLVLMVGLKGEIVKRLTDGAKVREYLQSVVPLPFNPSFKHKATIEGKFREEDYRVIELSLNPDDPHDQLYRPYSDSMFTHGEGTPPRFFDVKHKLGKGKLGFAWVCLNDARKYLPEKGLRGLLVKKFGFSVGDRRFFAPFFSRAVFNNRITGEIIITRKDLLPNASRTEFEPGPLRDSLYMAFSDLAQEISTWGDAVQNTLKAQEELDTITPLVFRILDDIKASERDVLTLLRYNNELASHEKALNNHRHTLLRTSAAVFRKTEAALEEAKKQIAEVLRSQQPARSKRGRMLRASKAKAGAPNQHELFHAEDKPASVLEALQAMDIEVSTPIRLFVDYLEQEVLRQKMDAAEYAEFLDDLMTYLEESL
jgi:hypothetical protein